MTPLPASALDQLGFLAGHWRGDRDDIVIEEAWLAPNGGVAQGSVRLLQNGKVGTIELIVVSAENDRVVMRYNHFNRDLSTWEGDGPIALTLTDASDERAVFTNLASPQRHAEEMGYRVTGADALSSWVVVINDAGARTRHAFDFKRLA